MKECCLLEYEEENCVYALLLCFTLYTSIVSITITEFPISVILLVRREGIKY
jgi:hypothetical protein